VIAYAPVKHPETAPVYDCADVLGPAWHMRLPAQSESWLQFPSQFPRLVLASALCFNTRKVVRSGLCSEQRTLPIRSPLWLHSTLRSVLPAQNTTKMG